MKLTNLEETFSGQGKLINPLPWPAGNLFVKRNILEVLVFS